MPRCMWFVCMNDSRTWRMVSLKSSERRVKSRKTLCNIPISIKCRCGHCRYYRSCTVLSRVQPFAKLSHHVELVTNPGGTVVRSRLRGKTRFLQVGGRSVNFEDSRAMVIENDSRPANAWFENLVCPLSDTATLCWTLECDINPLSYTVLVIGMFSATKFGWY